MKNACAKPYRLPRRRLFKVLTHYSEELHGYHVYAQVQAANADDAISQCPQIVCWEGEPVIEEIDPL